MMKHAAKASASNPAPKEHGKNQPKWQATLAVLRNADRLPTFGRSDNAFDTAVENRFTYGKAKAKEWDFDQSKATIRPELSKVERKDKRESGRHIFAFTPAVRSCYPSARIPEGNVTVWQGDRVAGRLFVTVIDTITKEETTFPVTVITNIVSVLSYGMIIEFSFSSRSKGAFKDSRSGRKPLSFAKSELDRLLGHTEGKAAYDYLTTLPPKK